MAQFSGGLDHVVSHLFGTIELSLIDFTEYNQGYGLIITDGDSWVWQRSVLS